MGLQSMLSSKTAAFAPEMSVVAAKIASQHLQNLAYFGCS
jgi:hypothetical protein